MEESRLETLLKEIGAENISPSKALLEKTKNAMLKADNSNSKSNRLRWVYSLSTACLIVVAFTLFFARFYTKAEPYAFLSIDINPSLEFSIDENARVLDVTTLNEDAKILIKGKNYKGVSSKEFVRNIVSQSTQENFINTENNAILIAASLNDDGKETKNNSNEDKEKRLDDILKVCETAVSKANNVNIRLKTLKVEPEVRRLAARNGISMGRYAIYEKAMELGNDIKLEDVKEGSIKDLVKNIEMPNPIKSENSTKRATPKPSLIPKSTIKPAHTAFPTIEITDKLNFTPTTPPTDKPTDLKTPKPIATPIISKDETGIIVDGRMSFENEWGISSLTLESNGNARGLKVINDRQYLYFCIEGQDLLYYKNNQIFINIDTQSDTGFSDHPWNSEGSDYMLENNELYKYIGNGTNWKWKYLKNISEKKSDAVIEKRVDLKDLGPLNVGQTIEVGFAFLTDNWAEKEYLPRGGKLPSYTLIEK